jgi:hypothetical protein
MIVRNVIVTPQSLSLKLKSFMHTTSRLFTRRKPIDEDCPKTVRQERRKTDAADAEKEKRLLIIEGRLTVISNTLSVLEEQLKDIKELIEELTNA